MPHLSASQSFIIPFRWTCPLHLLLAIGLMLAMPQAQGADAVPRLFFTSQGKTALINADGSGLKYLEFKVPNQSTWQPGPGFPHEQRSIFLSMEPRRDGPGRPFEEFYTQTPTHIWEYDLATDSLKELCTQQRIAPFETPALLIGSNRILVQVVKNKVGWIVSMRLDGSDIRNFTEPGEGLPYGFSLSPDGKRIAFHLASPSGYQVYTSDLEGKQRQRVAAQPGHLYFGPTWSPDGQWLAFIDCIPSDDPGHDWGEVCIAHPDGTGFRSVTTGHAMWFAATYGPRDRHGGGSNIPAWSHDGKILFPRRIPGSKVPWPYRVGQPDLDHFNRTFLPDQAQGGVNLASLDPQTNSIVDLTPPTAGTWDFRVSESPDRRFIAFCRAVTGSSPTLWIMETNGQHPRPITQGVDDRGVDHPRWVGQ